MGLLTLFSKRSRSQLAERDTLKTCAYDSTVASEPPFRGTYPVLGNGIKLREQFEKSHPSGQTVNSHYLSSTRSSLYLRPRSNVDRPCTAGSSPLDGAKGSSSLASRPTSVIIPPPPKKKYGPYRLPSKLSTDLRASSALAGPAPSPSLAANYDDSIRIGESSKTRGYVDLLDAQSRIKPSDFYGRIQATGAKNYDEDVADRNRPEISADFNNIKAQEMSLDYRDARSKWAPIFSKDVDNTGDEGPRRPRVRHSMSAGLRPKHDNTHAPDAFPERTSSLAPLNAADETPKAMSLTASARSERAARRKSMPSFSAAVFDNRPRSSSAARRREDEPDVFPDSLRNLARIAATQEREQTKPNMSSKRQALGSLHNIENQSRQKRGNLGKSSPALPPSLTDHYRRKSVTHHCQLAESRLLVKRQSLQGIRSSARGEIYEDTYQQKISLQASQSPRDRLSLARRQLRSTTDVPDTLHKSPPAKSTTTSNENNNAEPSQLKKHSRQQSTTSLSGSKSITAHEVENATIPELLTNNNTRPRNWSLTSETATASTMSSNPSFRPQSGHTANTSVDFSPIFPPRSAAANSHSDLSSIPSVPCSDTLLPPFSQAIPPGRKMPSMMTPSRAPSLTAVQNKYHQPPPPPPPSEFYLEDYVSSTDDGSMTPSGGSYEKDLLFSEKDYCNLSGGQPSAGLPGLFDAAHTIPASPSPDLTDLPTIRVPPGRDLQFPAFAEMGSSDGGFDVAREQQRAEDSSDDEINFDIPKSRPASTLYHPQAARELLSPERRQQPIGEDDDDDSDF